MIGYGDGYGFEEDGDEFGFWIGFSWWEMSGRLREVELRIGVRDSRYGYVSLVWVLYLVSVEGIRDVRADRRVRIGAPDERVRMYLSMLWNGRSVCRGRLYLANRYS